MKNLTVLLLFFGSITSGYSKKWSFEGALGLRQDFNKVKLVSGNVNEIESANPMVQANVNYSLSPKWSFASGLQVHDFTIRTAVDNFDFKSTMTNHFFLGIPVGANYFFRADKKFSIEARTGVLFLFSNLSESITGSSGGLSLNAQPGRFGFSKRERAFVPNTVGYISYLRGFDSTNSPDGFSIWKLPVQSRSQVHS